MKDRSPLQRNILQKTGMALVASGLLWIALLLQISFKMRDAPTGTHMDVQFGPLVLNEVAKNALPGGGFEVTFGFGSGLVWYFLLWAIVGAGIGFAATQYKNRQNT